MKEGHNRKGKRLRLAPLTAGAYGAFLGFGLTAVGLAGMEEGIGIVRILLGLVMACFGLYGIWDGVRDLVKPDREPPKPPVSQFILTDTDGNRSSNVTAEVLQEQLRLLAENGSRENMVFHLQILPPLSVPEQGMLKQVSCIYQEEIILAAFFEEADGRYQTCHKRTEQDKAEEWFRQFLSGSPDFAGWEIPEAEAGQGGTEINHEEAEEYEDETDDCPDKIEALSSRFPRTFGRRLLIIQGESWHDEHRFFSARDLELAVEGVYEGKYQRAVLEWGSDVFDIFPGLDKELTVVRKTDTGAKNGSRFFAKKGTAAQVKFWLLHDLDEDTQEEMSGWNDITDEIERKWRKHGKVF